MNEYNRVTVEGEKPYNGGSTKSHSVSFSLAKVFGIMFAWLMVTAIVMFGLGAILTYTGAYQNMGLMLGLTFGSGIALIIMSIVASVTLLKGNHSLAVPATLYAVIMGVMLASFTIFIDWRVLGIAFGITTLIFGLMTLIAVLSKGNMNGLTVVAFGLISGAGMLALVNLLVTMFTGAIIPSLYWIVEFSVFGFIMLITIWDIWRIKQIADNGSMSANINMYCAFTLYIDFVNIFLRVLYYLMIIMGKRR